MAADIYMQSAGQYEKAAIAYRGFLHVVDGEWKCGWLDDGSASMSNEFTVLSVEIWMTA